jgi:hypothetical protein
MNDNAGEMQPSAYGFRNIRPMTRPQRAAIKDKVALEKQRLFNVSSSNWLPPVAR